VVNYSFRPPLPNCHLQSVIHKFSTQMVGHTCTAPHAVRCKCSPAHHPSAPGIYNHRQAQEPSTGSDIGYVRHPQLIGAINGKVSLRQIRCSLRTRLSDCCSSAFYVD
jgi:hypothetical protein